MAFVIQLLSLLTVAGYAIKQAESPDWKLANLGIIIGSMFVGTALALAIGHDLDNVDIWLLTTFAIVGGFVGAFGSLGGNNWRSGGIRKGKGVRRPPKDKTVI